ncbi:unnamed protein product, partial [Nesidiocoris tenuis]
FINRFQRSSHRQYKTNTEHHNHDNRLKATTHVETNHLVEIGIGVTQTALLAGADEQLCEVSYQYGRNIGLAFQLVDDLLDFIASSDTMGKPTATDLKLGLATAPVLFACEKVRYRLPDFIISIRRPKSTPLLMKVPPAEPDDHAAVPGAGRRRKGLRAGAQIGRPRAGEIFGQKALQRSRPSGQHLPRIAIPESFGRRFGPGSQPYEISLPFFAPLLHEVLMHQRYWELEICVFTLYSKEAFECSKPFSNIDRTLSARQARLKAQFDHILTAFEGVQPPHVPKQHHHHHPLRHHQHLPPPPTPPPTSTTKPPPTTTNPSTTPTPTPPHPPKPPQQQHHHSYHRSFYIH